MPDARCAGIMQIKTKAWEHRGTDNSQRNRGKSVLCSSGRSLSLCTLAVYFSGLGTRLWPTPGAPRYELLPPPLTKSEDVAKVVKGVSTQEPDDVDAHASGEQGRDCPLDDMHGGSKSIRASAQIGRGRRDGDHHQTRRTWCRRAPARPVRHPLCHGNSVPGRAHRRVRRHARADAGAGSQRRDPCWALGFYGLMPDAV